MEPASSAALGEIVTGFEVVCDELGFTAGQIPIPQPKF
jgi:hypothetical protein